MQLSLNAPLAERLQYSPASVTHDEIADALTELDRLQEWLADSDMADTDSPLDDQIEALVDQSIANDYPDAAEYKQFFEDCFEALSAHYPCPEVTSDYDCQVILDAIRKGDDDENAKQLTVALRWALDQIEDDLDPEHQVALADARALLERNEQ
jgi:hypothetical protein